MLMTGVSAGGLRHIRIAVLPDGRVDRKNAAAYLGRASKTLAEWRSKGCGPRCFLVGGRAFYWLSDLEAFVASRPQRRAQAHQHRDLIAGQRLPSARQ